MRIRIKTPALPTRFTPPHGTAGEDDECTELSFIVSDFPEDATLETLLRPLFPHLLLTQNASIDDKSYPIDTPLSSLPLHEGSLITPNARALHSHSESHSWIVFVTAGSEAGYYYFLHNDETIYPTIPTNPVPTPTSTHNLFQKIFRNIALTVHNNRLYVRLFHPTATITLDNEPLPFAQDVEVRDGSYLRSAGATMSFHQHLPEEQVETSSTPPSPTISFNRPPQPQPPLSLPALEAPYRKEVKRNFRFSWTAILAPILIATVMVILLGSMRYALFALLSPIIALGSWLENKRRHRKEKKKEEERFQKAFQQFTRDIATHIDTENMRLEQAAPHLGVSVLRAILPTTGLWNRRTWNNPLTLRLAQPLSPTCRK